MVCATFSSAKCRRKILSLKHPEQLGFKSQPGIITTRKSGTAVEQTAPPFTWELWGLNCSRSRFLGWYFMFCSCTCLTCMLSWCHSACGGENCNKKLALGLSGHKILNKACEWLWLCCLSELPVLCDTSDISTSLSRGNSELGSLGVVTPQGHRGHFLFCGSETLHFCTLCHFYHWRSCQIQGYTTLPRACAAWLVAQLTVTSDT